MRRQPVEALAEAPLLWAGMAALAAAIFAVDTLTDIDIAVAVLYVAVVLISVRTGRAGAVTLVGGSCGGLTILSFFLSRHGAPTTGLANCAISLLAIGITTTLAIRIGAAAEATRQAEARLAHMARVTTMGELAASIAHEVSQPLAAIAAHGSAAQRWLAAAPPNRDEARHALERVVADAGRAGEVIARLRRLVMRRPPSHDPVDLGEVIAETVTIVRSEVRRHHAVLRTEVDAGLPPVIGDRIQLQQVVLNLLVNAVEAIGAAEGEPRELQVAAATDGRTVTVSVRDCGIGVPPAALDRMFEAFYTTKPTGMGMGLAISRSIVEAHGGTVYVAPNLPRGAVFGFVLPLRPEG
ncbi:sensor histidine kinase [Labrys wisconsinensis]|uniref:histidine kinase n=1 Tax=Labrys wisconsinensis TaxID=425677 RepID=A0ABU0J3X8_9HYPH|nr:ATP-binding protein [Labrys wisconsinensis]MDQ0468118.1 C4-dicarboxylate-specific signal transduction histidine kinase [Labrys wisconsinensis]